MARNEGTSAVHKVQAALQCDQERHRWLTREEDDHLANSSDDDADGDTGGKFKKVNRRLMNVNKWITSRGVQRSMLAQFGTFKHRMKVRSQDQNAFIGRMLNYAPLMKNVSSVLMEFRTPVFGAHAEWDKALLFNRIASALHEAKMLTINAAWIEHVKPLKDQNLQLSRRHDFLKAQFKEARTTYLKEVSELRDSVRCRGDPTMGINMDIAYFFEPTVTLDPEELKFMANMCKEKLKMIAEHNPQVAKTLDFGQMEAMMEKVEHHELKTLREALARKMDEVKKLQQIVYEQHSAERQQRPTNLNVDAESKSEQDLAIQALSRQVQDLESQRDEDTQQLRGARKRIECAEIERDELAAEMRSESGLRIMMQEECEHLRNQVEQQEEDIANLQHGRDNFQAAFVERDNTIATLRKRLGLRDKQLQKAWTTMPAHVGEEFLKNCEFEASDIEMFSNLQQTKSKKELLFTNGADAAAGSYGENQAATIFGTKDEVETVFRASTDTRGNDAAVRSGTRGNDDAGRSGQASAEIAVGKSTDTRGNDAAGRSGQASAEIADRASIDAKGNNAAGRIGQASAGTAVINTATKKGNGTRADVITKGNGKNAELAVLEDAVIAASTDTNARTSAGNRGDDAAGASDLVANDSADPNLGATIKIVQKENVQIYPPKFQEIILQKDQELTRLQQRCANLQKLVHKHLEEQLRKQTETAALDAKDLRSIAHSLGCGDNHEVNFKVSDGSRACKCGNLLMDDSKFCRKCGAQWQPPDKKDQHQRVAFLATRLGDIAGELADANKHLAEDLAHKEDPRRADRIAEAERRVALLKRQQRGFEVQLLAERTANAVMDEVELSELESPTGAQLIEEELEVTKDMLHQVQSLCTESCIKLKEATEDNMQLTCAFDSTLNALRSAKACISQAEKEHHEDANLKQGVARLAQAEHHATFHRLFNPNDETKSKWRQRRRKLLEETYAELGTTLPGLPASPTHLDVCFDDGTPETHFWQLSPPETFRNTEYVANGTNLGTQQNGFLPATATGGVGDFCITGNQVVFTQPGSSSKSQDSARSCGGSRRGSLRRSLQSSLTAAEFASGTCSDTSPLEVCSANCSEQFQIHPSSSKQHKWQHMPSRLSATTPRAEISEDLALEVCATSLAQGTANCIIQTPGENEKDSLAARTLPTPSTTTSSRVPNEQLELDISPERSAQKGRRFSTDSTASLIEIDISDENNLSKLPPVSARGMIHRSGSNEAPSFQKVRSEGAVDARRRSKASFLPSVSGSRTQPMSGRSNQTVSGRSNQSLLVIKSLQ